MIGAGSSLYSSRLVLRKANLVTDYRLGTVKVKSRNDQAHSLFPLSPLISGKEKKKLVPLFSFSIQQYHTGLDHHPEVWCLGELGWDLEPISMDTEGQLY